MGGLGDLPLALGGASATAAQAPFPPRDLLLDADGDLALSDAGDLMFATGNPAVVQAVDLALTMVRGEWFADPDAGLPYFDDPGIIGKGLSDAALRELYKNEIASVQDVLSVDRCALSRDRETRKLSVDFKVTSVYGTQEGEV